MRHPLTSTGIPAAAFTLLAACSGSGEGTDSPAPSDPPPPPANGDQLLPEFASIQAQVFSAVCTQCHIGGAAPEGLRLDADVAFGMLVEVPSSQAADLMRVAPGNPDDSYLVLKLEGTAAVGERMPLDSPPLDGDTITAIRQWISDGAQPPPDAMARALSTAQIPATLTTGWPMADARLQGPPRTLVVIADAALDVTRIDHASVQLRRPDQTEPGTLERREVAGLAIRASSQDPTRITVGVPKAEWTAGPFELRIAGSGPSPVTDLSGTAIDGNGDGRPGGDFVLRFTLETSP